MVANQPRKLSGSKVQVAHQPDDRCSERHHKQQENHSPLPSLFPQRTRPPAASAFMEVVSVFQGD